MTDFYRFSMPETALFGLLITLRIRVITSIAHQWERSRWVFHPHGSWFARVTLAHGGEVRLIHVRLGGAAHTQRTGSATSRDSRLFTRRVRIPAIHPLAPPRGLPRGRAVTPTGAGHPRSWTDSAAPTTEIDQGLRKRCRAPPTTCPFGRPTRRPILLAPSPCSAPSAPPPTARPAGTLTAGAPLLCTLSASTTVCGSRSRQTAGAPPCSAPSAPAPPSAARGHARPSARPLALHPQRQHPPPAGTPTARAGRSRRARGGLRRPGRCDRRCANAARAGQLQRSRSWTARQRATSFSYASVAASASPRERAARPAATRPGESSSSRSASGIRSTRPP
jgi:hypothetical protein